MRRVVMVGALLGLAACTPQEEIERAIAAANRQSCLDAGFVESSENYKLCLLIQDNNRRLSDVERRLSFIETDIRRVDTLYPYRRWP